MVIHPLKSRWQGFYSKNTDHPTPCALHSFQLFTRNKS